MDKVFVETPQNLNFGSFFDFLGPPDLRIFFFSFKNLASPLFLRYDYLTSCQKPEKMMIQL